MNQTVELKIQVSGAGEQEILIAQLAELGFEAFEQQAGQLIACMDASLYNEEAVNQILEGYNFGMSVLEAKNWNASWEASFEPVIVQGFCAIRAAFHAPIPDVPYEIIITPKMSFGTGHHATTWLMIERMRTLDISGKSVLDFGTGTGVLAILAEKMGASQTDAIDIDDWSIENAGENLQANACKNTRLSKGSSLDGLPHYQLILANINKHVLLAQMGSIKQHLTSDGVVVLSGLLAGDREDIVQSAARHSLVLIEEMEKDSWIALEFKCAH